MPAVAVGDPRLPGGVDHEELGQSFEVRCCRVHVQLAKVARERDLGGGRECRLIAEEQDMVLSKRLLDGRHIARTCQIGTRNLRPDHRGDRRNVDAHGGSRWT